MLTHLHRTGYHSGIHAFQEWEGNMRAFYSKFLGEFDGNMTAERADKILHDGRITKEASDDFMRGWNEAQNLWKKNNTAGL